MSSTTTTIEKVPSSAEDKGVYRRKSGELFLKLNEQFHVRTKLSGDGKTWLGDGCAEELDPNESVELVQPGETGLSVWQKGLIWLRLFLK